MISSVLSIQLAHMSRLLLGTLPVLKRTWEKENKKQRETYYVSHYSILHTSALNSQYQGSRPTAAPAPRNPPPSLHSTRACRRDHPQSIRITLSPSL